MYYVAYGMNTNVESMQARAPSAVWLGKITLPKHKLVFKYFADIEQADTDMFAVLWKIDHNVLTGLDAVEGYPTFYERKKVDIVHEQNIVSAWVYYMNAPTAYGPPSSSYLTMVTEGYASAGIELHQK